MQSESVLKIFGVAIILCLFCSVIVSGSAIFLRPYQEENRIVDIKKNILLSAGLLDNPKAKALEVNQAFKQVKSGVVDLSKGIISPSKENQKDGLIKIYWIQKTGKIDLLILPVQGKGLWSTLYGFIALDADTTTVRGFGFYQHGETPGLGGEVDNIDWKKSWIGKKVFNQDFQPAIKVVKGKVNLQSSEAIYQIDGLAGATITSRGVEELLHRWLGDKGFGPFLKNIREGKI